MANRFCHERALILGSQSERRQAMLSGLGLRFTVVHATVDETPLEREQVQDYLLRISLRKAKAVCAKLDAGSAPFCVIAADTVVVRDEQILQKPRNRQDAQAMLTSLSGRWHQVYTAYALAFDQGIPLQRIVCTQVLFKDLTHDEVEAYLKTGEYRDKAGAYAIQGQANYMVKEIKGSYTNVVGLPLAELMEDLLAAGVLSFSATVDPVERLE